MPLTGWTMSSINAWSPERLNDSVGDTLAFIRDRDRLQLALFVAPAVLFMFATLILPVFYMVYISFLSDFPTGGEFTVENYVRMATTDAYVQITLDTVVLTVQTVSLVLVFGYVIAYGIAMFGKRKKLLLLAVVLPFWTNYLVRNYAVMAIFQNDGPVHQILNYLAFVPPVEILFTRTAVLIGLVYSFLPVAILPIYASISRMDKSLISASKDLGAGPIKTFLYITLPETKDGIFVGSLLVGVPTFGAFVTPGMLGGPSDNMIGSIINLQVMSVYDIPFAAAIGTSVALFVLGVIGVLITIGGVPMIDRE